MFNFLKKLLGQEDNEQIIAAIKSGAILVDVRTPGEFSSGSVKGAVNVPLDKVSNKLGVFKGKKSVIVFCRSGNRSGQAKNILKQNGIQNVINGGTWMDLNKLVNNK
jgi:rhodanese-related sulfurtransferase